MNISYNMVTSGRIPDLNQSWCFNKKVSKVNFNCHFGSKFTKHSKINWELITEIMPTRLKVAFLVIMNY